MKTNDFVIDIATSNGSGSQTANLLLTRTLFRMGIPVAGKNLFPSNIQGLPTWFSIRVQKDGFLSRSLNTDIVVAMNAKSIAEDIQKTDPGGVFIYNRDLKFDTGVLREDVNNIDIPFKSLVAKLEASPKLRKLLTNMVYVGILGQLIGLDKTVLDATLTDIFAGKESLIETNQKALDVGWTHAEDELDAKFPYKVQAMDRKNQVLIDGNTAAALGLADGGATFAAWYPITPSSSLVESFAEFARLRPIDCPIVQAEDELASIAMVTGAGWAGARAFTATSGPGLSLMSEFAGLCYFAEIPAVIWDVQRVGPSTGLPTRTLQGDLNAAAHLSHGDTEHIVLLPADPQECFEFGKLSLDLAEHIQTLVIVLSDLDLGMNQHTTSPPLRSRKTPLNRGKIATNSERFKRYADIDGDGIPERSVPGMQGFSYFTRGTGHDENSAYTESAEEFRKKMLRLKRKFQTALESTPAPAIQEKSSNEGLLYYGSTAQICEELDHLYPAELSRCRVRSLPLHQQVADFIRGNEITYVVEQNRDNQMYRLIIQKWPELYSRLKPIGIFGGQAISAQEVLQKMESPDA